ncbi:IclR family transcriptional regulator [Streptacidiphilus jiangxiensis]|uniref:DNA-binding transcriptional regulator, IclR family n=1 Tax=Streptacidiphilus jiangxiensis TaxID=235985 RepID=A0A1H7H4M3_STRJI|nr:IclR family transcriptional regulator C-terminal domain-containing protein [Streptacidiphilus jiangxiensis]SEK44242.1 DNA-binding transcriptional regulator, IclR family [Streptacidiphilus jiangxiensis]
MHKYAVVGDGIQSEAPETAPARGPLRVFRVAQALAVDETGGSGPTLLGDRTGLGSSVVQRILHAGAAAGAFERERDGTYRLGPLSATLGVRATVRRGHGLDRRAILQELHASTGGGVCTIESLTMLGGASSSCIDLWAHDGELETLRISRTRFLGTARPLRVGAAGRVLLASMPRTLLKKVAAEPLPDDHGPGAIADPEAFRAAVITAREDGYGHACQELWSGWDTIAAPIRWGDVIGAVALAKPTSSLRLRPDLMRDTGQVITAAARIEALLRRGE